MINNGFIVFDAGYKCGWAFFNNGYVSSGLIDISKNLSPYIYLEEQIKELLEKYKPKKAYIEEQSHFVRMGNRPINVKAVQKYTTAWEITNKVIDQFGIPCESINTRRLARKKMAQIIAMQITNRKRISTHEAETVC